MTHLPVRRALISVSDKTGLIDFATALAAGGVALVSRRAAPRPAPVPEPR